MQVSQEDFSSISKRTSDSYFGYIFDSSASPEYVWEIWGYSGHYQYIPYGHVERFLALLAREIAPYYTMFRLLANEENGERKMVHGVERVPVPLIEQPTCLSWPHGERLVDRTPPEVIEKYERFFREHIVNGGKVPLI